MVKPGELIDIKEISPLTLTDRRIYNLLIANAWDRITEPVEHVIDKSDLMLPHTGMLPRVSCRDSDGSSTESTEGTRASRSGRPEPDGAMRGE